MTIKILKKKSFKDKRGLLWTTWKKKEFNKISFNHDKFSYSKNKVLRDRPKVKIKRIAYTQTSEYKKKRKEYSQRPEVKAKAKSYKQTLEYKTKDKTTRDNKRLKLLQHYSQHLSTSSRFRRCVFQN